MRNYELVRILIVNFERTDVVTASTMSDDNDGNWKQEWFANGGDVQ